MKAINIQSLNRNLFFIVVIYVPILLLVSLIVTNRSSNFRDYPQYLILYENFDILLIEPSYRFISWIFHDYDNGFLCLLFVYAIIGLVLKTIYVKTILSNRNFFIYLIFYLCAFFVLWDFIQIRTSAAITFFLLASLLKNKILKIMFFVFSLLFHFSFFIPIGFYLTIYFFRNKYVSVFIIFILSIIFLIVNMELGIFEKYAAENYSTSLSPLLIAKGISCMFLVFYGFSKVRKNISQDLSSFYYTGLGVFIFTCLLFYGFPQAASRYLDISLFILCFFSIIYFELRNNFFNLLYVVWFVIFCFINVWALYLSPKGLIFS